MTAKRGNQQQQQARQGAGNRQQPAPQGAGHGALEWIKSFAIGFLIFLVVRTFLIQTFTIVSGSMEGTLLVGDFLLLNKSAYGASVPGTQASLPGYDTPQRGDIIVFRGHHEDIDLVKRLVGMPGDTLRMERGRLYVNGQAQREPYVRNTDPHGDGGHPWMDWQAAFLTDSAAALPYYPSRDAWGPIVVPDSGYFVLGDNRDESLDSRYWGFIARHQIKGRAVGLYFSWDHRANGGLPVVSRVRWNRIGERLR
jgi:signal peptidase I